MDGSLSFHLRSRLHSSHRCCPSPSPLFPSIGRHGAPIAAAALPAHSVLLHPLLEALRRQPLMLVSTPRCSCPPPFVASLVEESGSLVSPHPQIRGQSLRDLLLLPQTPLFRGPRPARSSGLVVGL
jgi:hypothetical protein